jgi:hypothetical protein
MSPNSDEIRIDSIRCRLAALRTNPAAEEARAAEMADDLMQIRLSLEAFQDRAKTTPSELERARAKRAAGR